MASTPANIPRPTAKPRRPPRPPPQRLRSSRTPSPFVPSSPAAPSQVPPKKGQLICPNVGCGSTDIVEDGGSYFCQICGMTVAEGSSYVSDTQWTENAAGASQVQGQFVGAGQTHARGANLPSRQGITREPVESQLKTRATANTAIQSYATNLNIREPLVSSANRVFGLALQFDFLSGRTIENVAAVCLYAACRRFDAARDPTSTAATVMLIDFAEMLGVNVFLLGHMYTKLITKIYGSDKPDVLLDSEGRKIQAAAPEVLIERFVRELEFPKEDIRKVKVAAVDIIKRMKRDWLTTGRRPAGICGAAIILAARMFNYRRTVREVVLVAKVTEQTINLRLEEFQYTEASNLTVAEFQEAGVRDSLRETDPPAYYRALGLGPKKKRKREKKGEQDTAAELEGDEDEDGEDESSNGQASTKRVRFDMQGFKIPPIPHRSTPIDPQLQTPPPSNSSNQTTPDAEQLEDRDLQAAPPAKRRGRPAGSKNWQPPPPTVGDLALENEIEEDVQYVLQHNDTPTGRPTTRSSARSQQQQATPSAEPEDTMAPEPNSMSATNTSQDTSIRDAGQQSKFSTPAGIEAIDDPSQPVATAWLATRAPRGPSVDANDGNTGAISLSPTILPTEFDEDPEVSICLLSQVEVQIKERIWVEENADWLRRENGKRVRHELKERDRRERGISEDPKKRKGKKARKTKLGDVSYQRRGGVEGGEEGDGQGEREGSVRSAADAVDQMVRYRGVPSRRLNYLRLDEIYGNAGGGSGESEGSRSRSRSASVASTSTTMTGQSASGGRTRQSFAAEQRERRKREVKIANERSGSVTTEASAGADGEEGDTVSTGDGKILATTASRPSPTTPRPKPRAAASGRSKPSRSLLVSPKVSDTTSIGSAASKSPPQRTARPTQISPSPASDADVGGGHEAEDEVLGSIDDEHLSSSTSSRVDSPVIGQTQHGFDEDGGDDDDTEGDEDDYVNDQDEDGEGDGDGNADDVDLDAVLRAGDYED